MKPYVPTRFLTPEQLESRRLKERLRRRLKRGLPLVPEAQPDRPLSPSTERVRAWRKRQKELRASRVAASMSPKSVTVPPPVPPPVPRAANPAELSPPFKKLGLLTAAVLCGHPYTKTPEFLLALTDLEFRLNGPSEIPAPLMPDIVLFDK